MPRNGSGTYTLPSGNPVVSGTIIESTWANSTLADLADAITNSLARNGEGGMTAPLRLTDGVVATPSLAFANETGSGLYRAAAGDIGLSVLGSRILRLQAAGASVTGTLGVSGDTSLANLAYTGTLTGGTGVINIGSGQVYKDAAGNLGLGVTPSAWGTFSGVLEFAGGANIEGFSTGLLGMGSNHYFNGTNFIYKISSFASRYLMDNTGGFKWLTAPSGTAGNAITFTQAMTLTAAGDLGIGTTSPGLKLDVNGSIRALSGCFVGLSGTNGFALLGTSAGTGSGGVVVCRDASSSYNTSGMEFYTNNTERARIDSSGNLLVGATSQVTAGGTIRSVSKDGTWALVLHDVLNNALAAAFVASNNAQVGSITLTTSATSYNTSSDYRLKNITGELKNSGNFIDALKPKVGTWKVDDAPFVGFLAHEFAEVSPSSVHGQKDAVDKDGNPIYQSMQASSSEVMANIIAELQSLRKRVAELEAA